VLNILLEHRSEIEEALMKRNLACIEIGSHHLDR
jgi:hypothetical protein